MAEQEKLDGFLAEFKTPLSVILERVKADLKSPLWFTKYFSFAPKQVSLDFATIFSDETIEEMAAVIHDGSEIPLMGKDALGKLQGEMPTIAIAIEMTAKEYRDLLSLRGLVQTNDQVLYNQILDLIYAKAEKVGNSVLRRLNGMALQAVSTGTIILDTDNNPNGVKWTLDLGIPAANKRKVLKKWSDPTAKILTEIKKTNKEFRDKGKYLEKILVSDVLFDRILDNDEIKNGIKQMMKLADNVSVDFLTTEETVNSMMRKLRLPVFEIVEAVTPVAKDGVKSLVNSWAVDNAVFIPAGNIGIIHSAYNNEVIMGEPNVYQYGDYFGVQIMQWFNRRPATEYTAAEFIGIPGHSQVKNVVILQTETV
ncbi:hypothetical protein ACR79K_25395 [Sphingobacterium siyangense]|uniref:hypothetical protein n=1 Tax=Sphingobacterium siyangense TaxID=459529 RepID=UPI003DA24A8E